MNRTGQYLEGINRIHEIPPAERYSLSRKINAFPGPGGFMRGVQDFHDDQVVRERG